MSAKRPVYDCDTSDYWCSEKDYNAKNKKYGSFIDDGKAYQITNPETPRPWLNYFANHKFGSVTSNRGLGFTWYRSSLLRLTKYEHPVDYLPREFQDGREVTVEDLRTSRTSNILRDAKDLICTHRPGYSVFTGTALGLKFEMTLFVPLEDSCEIWSLELKNPSKAKRELKVSFSQIWTFSKFGIHTAEDGIPYISIPGKDLKTSTDKKGCYCHSTNKDLPYEMYGVFQSPQSESAEIRGLPETRNDGRKFVFNLCELRSSLSLNAGQSKLFQIVSGADTAEKDFKNLKSKYLKPAAYVSEFRKVTDKWQEYFDCISCAIPDKNMQNFLNAWFKNQLNLIFHFVRSGQNGYRDSLQDVWGLTLMDPKLSEERLYEILSYQLADGTAPRNFSSFNDGKHDMRRFMDSPTWIARTLSDLIKETGKKSILDKKIPFINGKAATIDEHVWRSLDYLFSHRGKHGICLTGDGDWNDALEGISKQGDAESLWLTIAVYDAMMIMIDLYRHCGKKGRAEALAQKADELKKVVNAVGWDGQWYVYGFTGSGKPIGSKINKEGKIHLNAQTWAVFSGLADKERAKIAMKSVEKHLDTPLGPVLMTPPYVHEAAEVGRIARLEPGTFENASIYQHAVSFHIFANLAIGEKEKAFKTFVNLLPTNPKNFDSRRTSEPYCTGNYYCGPKHKRFGQNFFTWFTGNASWLMRAGFDEMLGVKAGFDGLEINPRVPTSWKKYTMTRKFRGCQYKISFVKSLKDKGIKVNGRKIAGNVISPVSGKKCDVTVYFS
ncbi:MAG: hypothetical protein A2X45_09840 [Lentisphaerae bacterium GWF2_50_93]|nr:MAG: hypothetical protein A2X45_09840 [Lentisphaerae bacterium GWF2_50_93]